MISRNSQLPVSGQLSCRIRSSDESTHVLLCCEPCGSEKTLPFLCRTIFWLPFSLARSPTSEVECSTVACWWKVA